HLRIPRADAAPRVVQLELRSRLRRQLHRLGLGNLPLRARAARPRTRPELQARCMVARVGASRQPAGERAARTPSPAAYAASAPRAGRENGADAATPSRTTGASWRGRSDSGSSTSIAAFQVP